MSDGIAAEIWVRDEPWQRLPWLLPAAFAVTFVSLMTFLHLLVRLPALPRLPQPVELSIVELPPDNPPVVLPPPPPAPVEPPPQEQVTPPPEEPVNQPAVVKPPPPPTQHRQTKRPPVPPVVPAPPVAITPPPPQVAPQNTAPQLPGGGAMGARAIYQPMPQIPDEMRQHAIDTVAVVRFHIAPDGSATVELREATDDPRLNQVLLEGFKLWRFFPAMDHNNPVASILELRVPIQVK